MKILYLAVHRHKGWGAEHWLSRSFERQGCVVERFDYRQLRRQLMPWWLIRRQLLRLERRIKPDIVFLQRAENMPLSVPAALQTPVVFWSTEQLVRRRDVDQLLAGKGVFKWVYVHTYTCLDYVATHFPSLLPGVSVLHNATGVETISDNPHRSRLAIFNRNLSPRRREWLAACDDLVDVVSGRYGEQYFEDLSQSRIALNIHFASASLDDFETGIYEALASGCAVISETLDKRTVSDLGMGDAVLQVASAAEMRQAILQLRDDPDELCRLAEQGRAAIAKNLWDARASQLLQKFRELLAGGGEPGSPSCRID